LFYIRLSSHPPIFWPVPKLAITDDCKSIPTRSDTGDDCHYDLVGLKDKSASRLLKTQPLEAFLICAENGHRPANHEELIGLKEIRDRELDERRRLNQSLHDLS
jgi:hypothetical protein